MKYNFDEIIPRRNSNSVKWDLADNDRVLPMWVADMDFRTAPSIIEAIERRVQHGIFGYTKVPQAYFDAVTGWFQRRHQFTFRKEWTLYTTGVISAVSAIIKALTVPGDKVIVQTPVYHCFFASIRNNECECLSNQLIYKDGTYTVDFDDLEEKTSDSRAKLLILCNPHNPVGRVWSREELTRIGNICLKSGITIVSDEIHCDLVYQGYRHTPFVSINDDFCYRSVTCTAPSKTFNIAGLQCANIHAMDENIREKIDKALKINEVSAINPFAVEALIAAYNDSEDWLEELINYLYDNYLYLKDFFARRFPQLSVLPLEATYLVWVDCSILNRTSNELAEILLEKGNLWVNAGTMYGAGGENFIRLNIACPRQLLDEGLRKIERCILNQ